ncbi:TrbM/KikA/MpfK family conjugal transfer protein [Lautropia mirabilis]
MKKTCLAAAIASLMLTSGSLQAHNRTSDTPDPAGATDPSANLLEGDIRLACEAVLCLSSSKGLDAKECRPSLKRYFKIKLKRSWRTHKARKNFLKLCPLSNDEQKTPEDQDDFLEELMFTADVLEQGKKFEELMAVAEQEDDEYGMDSLDGQSLLSSTQAEDDTADAGLDATESSSANTVQASGYQSSSPSAASSTGVSRSSSADTHESKNAASSESTTPTLNRSDSLSPTPDKPATTPVQTGRTLCLSAAQIVANQGEGDGHIAGVNSSWTWSHAGWASTAKRGYQYQPDWVKNQFGWMRDVPESKWTLMMPWYAAGRVAGQGNGHVDIEIGNMSAQYYSKSQKRWITLGSNMKASGGTYSSGGSGAGTPNSTTGSTVGIPPGQFAHGWFSFVQMPPNDDVQAVSIAVQARSKSGTPVLVTAGADYYPNDYKSRLGNGPLMPGVGTGAPRLVGSDWSTVSFTTLSNQTSDGSGISPAELQRSRPHCN